MLHGQTTLDTVRSSRTCSPRAIMSQRTDCGRDAGLVGSSSPSRNRSLATRVHRQGTKRPLRLASRKALIALAKDQVTPGLSSDSSSSSSDERGRDSDSDYSAPRVRKRCRGSNPRCAASSPERPCPSGARAISVDSPARVRAMDLRQANPSSNSDDSSSGAEDGGYSSDPDHCAPRMRRQGQRGRRRAGAVCAEAPGPHDGTGRFRMDNPTTGSPRRSTVRALRSMVGAVRSQRANGRDCTSPSSLPAGQEDSTSSDESTSRTTVNRGLHVVGSRSQVLHHRRLGAGCSARAAHQGPFEVLASEVRDAPTSSSSYSSLSETDERDSGTDPDSSSPRVSPGRRSARVSRVRHASGPAPNGGRPQRERQLDQGRLTARGAVSPSRRRGQARSLVTPSRSSRVNFVLRQPVNFGLPVECPHCHARLWNAERSNGHWICCGSGSEVLPASLFPPVDPELRELFSQRKFSFHSRSINNHLAFTSIGTTPNTAQGGRGMNFRLPFPSSARLQGKTYHVVSATTQYAPGYGPNLYYIQVRRM
jgi:hypothetical protein